MSQDELEPFSAREILKCALQNEKIAQENYKAIGEIMLGSDNFPVARIFFEASKMEKEHFRKLQKGLKTLYGIIVDEETPLPFAAGCAPGSGDNPCALDIRAGMQQDDAIRFLEETEQAAEAFYREAVVKTGRMEMKILFKTLADEEGGHYRSVRGIVRGAVASGPGAIYGDIAPEIRK